MSPAPQGGKLNRREGKLKERREARSGAGERGPGYGPCRPHPTPGDFLPSLFLITSPWQPISPSSSAPAPLPSPWRFWGAFPPLLQPLLTLIFLSVPTSAPIPRGSQHRAGIYRGAPQPPHAAGLGGTFPGPPNSIKGRGQWMEHPWSSGGGGTALISSPRGSKHLPITKGTHKAFGQHPWEQCCRPQPDEAPGSRVTDPTCWGGVG